MISISYIVHTGCDVKPNPYKITHRVVICPNPYEYKITHRVVIYPELYIIGGMKPKKKMIGENSRISRPSATALLLVPLYPPNMCIIKLTIIPTYVINR
mgnify:CR=1 FL=1